MPVALERELDTFTRQLPDLLADPFAAGRFALVHGDAVAGVFPTFDAALQAGYDRFGVDPFLVNQVTAHEEPRYVSRSLKPCR